MKLGKIFGRDSIPNFSQTEFSKNSEPRALFYCASNIGLGHMGRVVRVIDRLKKMAPKLNVLLVTDAKDLSLAARSEELAVAKLPSFTFDEGEKFDERPFGLGFSKRQMMVLRQNMLLSLASSFQPDLLYMDTLPHGKRDEMLPVLRHLKKHEKQCQTVLCIRDIPCAPGEKQKLSGDEAKILKHARLYDTILAASDRKFFDLAENYKWPLQVQEKLEYLGFVVPQPENSKDWRESSLCASVDSDAKNIVASFGGGWEAAALSAALTEALTEARKNFAGRLRLFIFTGPAISNKDFESLTSKMCDDPLLRIEKISTFFPNVLAKADLAILQAGSTPFQILDSAIPMLLYCREYKIDEQALRAKLLARHEGIELIDRATVDAGELTGRIGRALSSPPPRRKTGYGFNGARRAAEILAGALRSGAKN